MHHRYMTTTQLRHVGGSSFIKRKVLSKIAAAVLSNSYTLFSYIYTVRTEIIHPLGIISLFCSIATSGLSRLEWYFFLLL